MLRQTIFRVVKNGMLKIRHKMAYKIKRCDGFVKIFVENAIQYSLHAFAVKKAMSIFVTSPLLMRKNNSHDTVHDN